MLLPLAGFVCVGLPGILLAVWFSWLVRRQWLRGRVSRVIRTWLLCLALIAGSLTALAAPFLNTGFGLPYNVLVCFCVFVIAGGIPSAVILLVVSCLTRWLDDGRGDREAIPVAIVLVGTLSGIITGVFTVPICLGVTDALWHR